MPYQRRRRVEGLLRDAKINAEWIGVPTPDEIHAADRERLLAKLAEPVEFDEADVELGARLLAEKTPEDIAALLVRAYRAKLPAPEELSAGGVPERRERQEGPRPGFEDTVWFRMNVGRRHNADPRWLLPLLCRRGHITKGEIGAIRIANDESAFEIPKAIAAKFIASVKRTATPDDDLMFEQMSGPPAAPQRRTTGAPPRHSAKPYRGGRRG